MSSSRVKETNNHIGHQRFTSITIDTFNNIFKVLSENVPKKANETLSHGHPNGISLLVPD